MKITTQLFSLAIVGAVFGLSTPSFAEDWTIPAYHACNDAFNSATTVKSGYRAKPGGTSVIVCPLTKEVASNALKNVYVRLKRANANSVAARCNITTYSPYGTSYIGNYKYAAANTSNQSLSLAIPSQSSTNSGYAMVSCLLQPGDEIYGVRFIQVN